MTAYDKELCERLCREVREDDTRASKAPWQHRSPERPFSNTVVDGDNNPIAAWLNGRVTMLQGDAGSIARTRNNLRALADQLEAAGAEVERLTAESDLRGRTVADLAHELGTIKGKRDLERPVVARAEHFVDVMRVVTLSILVGLVAGAFLGRLWIGERMYSLGEADGRRRQNFENRVEIEAAIVAKARAEQLAETWAKRARALLYAHFGPEQKP